MVVVIVVVILVLLALIGIGFTVIRSSDAGRAARDPESDPTVGSTAIGPSVSKFHVRGETAFAVFDVPLGESEAGQHLIDLLSMAAVEYVRSRSAQGLPLDGVHRIDVSAMRAGQPESIAVVELPSPGVLPAPVHRTQAGGSLIAALNEVVADSSVSAKPAARDTLEPVASFVELTGPSEARLRMVGVDTSTMSLAELTDGLLRAGGYTISASDRVMTTAPAASVQMATKPGERVAVVVLPHTEGDYPEVGEKVFGEVAVLAGQTDAQRVMLVSDKFGPYSMYERERRDKRLVFVTRERLQAFVDSFGLS
ncbi:MAG: hypothetical protein DWP92_08780 [Armatimonadetes bacterium]|nr:MAG: hypothetical protein DWP92_08780 [Armatimonadota bacterium]